MSDFEPDPACGLHLASRETDHRLGEEQGLKGSPESFPKYQYGLTELSPMYEGKIPLIHGQASCQAHHTISCGQAAQGTIAVTVVRKIHQHVPSSKICIMSTKSYSPTNSHPQRVGDISHLALLEHSDAFQKLAGTICYYSKMNQATGPVLAERAESGDVI